MTWLLRHNFWMVKLLGLVVVMALVANTTTTVVALYLLADAEPHSPRGERGDDEDDASAPVYASNDRARQAERAVEQILGRNAFCPSCGPTPPPDPGGGISQDPPTDGDLSGARRSQLPLAVAATMEHEDPSLSVTTLIDTQRGVGGLYGVGDLVGGQIEIVHVATGVVHISNNGVLEYIPFGQGPPPPAAKKPGKPKPATPRKPKGAIDGAEEAIQCSDKGSCVVDRAFVEKLFAKPELLVGQGGASPAKTKDGAPGFRLRGVRRGTLPDLLGLKNGDVITEVGGSPLTMDQVAGLYGKLRHASHVEVTVDRRGKRMRRQLEIRS